MRKMMQRGERPRECEYCWKVEDMETDAVSDRVFKSIIYTNEDLQKAHEMDHNESVDLKTFEIAFDRTCRFVLIVTHHSLPHGRKTLQNMVRIRTWFLMVLCVPTRWCVGRTIWKG